MPGDEVVELCRKAEAAKEAEDRMCVIVWLFAGALLVASYAISVEELLKLCGGGK